MPVAKKSIKKAVKKVATKVAKKAIVKKAVVKKAIAKRTTASKKSVVAKKTVQAVVKKSVHAKAIVKKNRPESKITKPAKPIVSKQVLKPVKDRNDVDKKMELKAQRVLKELEERMDLSKVKPRISVPMPQPKPKPAPPIVKLPEPENTTKEKLQLEFEVRSSRNILFYYLHDASGLEGWFADNVKEKDGIYTFTWEGSTQVAKLVAMREHSLARFQWDTENDGTYFQFEIKEDEITGDIALIITDWITPGERESNGRLWETQVLALRHLIGS